MAAPDHQPDRPPHRRIVQLPSRHRACEVTGAGNLLCSLWQCWQSLFLPPCCRQQGQRYQKDWN